MNNVLLVTEGNGSHDLLHHIGCKVLAEVFHLNNFVKKLTTFTVVGCEVEVLLVVPVRVKSHYVLVVQVI